MEGREHMVGSRPRLRGSDADSIPQVRNEINVLKRISRGHPNIVTLHDVSRGWSS